MIPRAGGWQQAFSLRRGPSAIGWVHPAEGKPGVAAVNKKRVGGVGYRGCDRGKRLSRAFPRLPGKKSSDALRQEGP